MQRPVQAVPIQNVWGPQVGLIYNKTVSLVPISTPKYSFGNETGPRRRFTSLQQLETVQFITFRVFISRRIPDQFQKALNEIYAERTSSVLKSSPDE